MREDGMEVGEKRISNICYADSTVLILDSLGGLQNMLLWVAGVSLEHALEINAIKTKWMIVHKRKDAKLIKNDCIQVDDREIKRVDKFLHLAT